MLVLYREIVLNVKPNVNRLSLLALKGTSLSVLDNEQQCPLPVLFGYNL